MFDVKKDYVGTPHDAPKNDRIEDGEDGEIWVRLDKSARSQLMQF